MRVERFSFDYGSKERRENSISVAIGLYLPPHTINNEEIESWGIILNEEKGTKLTAERIRNSVGAEVRHMAKDEGVVDMAVRAFENIKRDAEKIDVVLFSTSYPTGENLSKSLGMRLGLKSGNFDHCDFHFACSGFTAMLSHIKENEEKFLGKNILLAASEKYSGTVIDLREQDAIRNDPSRAFIIFSDGASVFLGRYGSDFEILSCSKMIFSEADNQKIKMPIDKNLMVPPFQYYPVPYAEKFYQDGRGVFRAVGETIPGEILRTIEAAKLTVEDIDLIIPHQGSLKVVKDMVEDRLVARNAGFKGKVVTDIKDGNLSSASIPKAIRKSVEKGRLKKGNIAVLAGFGAGLLSVTAVVRFN